MADISQIKIPPGISLENIIESVELLCQPTAIALYGSRARGNNDVFSDIDVLVIAPKNEVKRAYRMLGGVAFDILAGTIDEFCSLLDAQPRTNDFEVVLYAALAAISIHDPQEVLGKLQLHARRIWQSGPRPLSEAEIEQTRSRLIRLLRSAERIVVRASKDPSYAVAGIVRCDYLVVESIYYYFRINRRWTTDFPKLIKQLQNEDSHLGTLCGNYASAVSIADRLRCARQIYSAVITVSVSRSPSPA